MELKKADLEKSLLFSLFSGNLAVGDWSCCARSRTPLLVMMGATQTAARSRKLWWSVMKSDLHALWSDFVRVNEY
jgi:hypothetical protein